jgi:hypothetical protein
MTWDHPKDTRLVFRGLAYAIGLTVVAWLGVLVFPHHLPHLTHPNIWNTGLDNQWFLEAMRVVVIVAGMYIVVSVAALIHYGRWLTKFGPLATEKQIRKVRSRVKFLEKALATATAENERLTNMVEEGDAMILRLHSVARGEA